MEPFTHAGGVVFRDRDGSREVLLVTARDDPRHWVLPKGHIEPGETAEAAAVREVREESGVEAEVVEALGSDAYAAGDAPVRTLYFAMRFVRACRAEEARERRWLPIDEAARRASFDGPRRLIERARRVSA